MWKLLLPALTVALVGVSHLARAVESDPSQDFYRYTERVASAAPGTPFIGSAADGAAFIGYAGGGSVAADEQGGSGSSLPLRAPPSPTLLAKAAMRAAAPMETAR
jgi:hypothetical protein